MCKNLPRPSLRLRRKNDRIEALKKLRLKLLDLTGRNRLINFKHTKGKSLQFVEGNLHSVFQKLVNGTATAQVNIVGLPEPLKSDVLERDGRMLRPQELDWARSHDISTSYDIAQTLASKRDAGLRAFMYNDDLAKHCRKIAGSATLAIEETGANMLYLVLGFLDFPDQKDSSRIFSAPLICVPVSLHKREVSGEQAFALQFTGEDISENLSLREKLARDFAIILPELDDEEIDLNSYFDSIAQVIKNKLGFALKYRISLCLLNVGTMLLFRDLDPKNWPENGNGNSLTDHSIVRVVLEGDADSTMVDDIADYQVAEEHAVEDGEAAQIPLVYDADSSQHSALVDVLLLKRNLVIHGPPGTGKSQTITNLIAACLASGKSVLFVAEKLAALEVVKRRLEHVGLAPFVLELHSTKTSKKQVLDELNERLDCEFKNQPNLLQQQQRLEAHRSDLKTYAVLMNSVSANSLGLTPHQLMWRAETCRQALSCELNELARVAVGDAATVSISSLAKQKDCLNQLSRLYETIQNVDLAKNFRGFVPNLLYPGDEVQLNILFQAALRSAKFLNVAAKSLHEILGTPLSNAVHETIQSQLKELAALKLIAAPTLQLQLAPHLFKADKDIDDAATVLAIFAETQCHYRKLQAEVRKVFKTDLLISSPLLGLVRETQQKAKLLGAMLGDSEEIAELSLALGSAVKAANIALKNIVAMTHEKNIAFNGHVIRLKLLAEFTALATVTPNEHLHLQSAGLANDGCFQSLSTLLALQRKWVPLEQELGAALYISNLPTRETIKQAIATLREGNTWYRLAQKKWRLALNVHKSIQKNKARISLGDRLAQLERIDEYLNFKARWQQHVAWAKYLNIAVPDEPLDLAGYLILSKWNCDLRAAAGENQIVLTPPIDFGVGSIRALRAEYTALHSAVGNTISALAVIDSRLPALREPATPLLVTDAIASAEQLHLYLVETLPWLGRECDRQMPFAMIAAGCQAAIERDGEKSALDECAEVKHLLPNFFKGSETDVTAAQDVLAFGEQVDKADLLPEIKIKLKSGAPITAIDQIARLIVDVNSGLVALTEVAGKLQKYGGVDLAVWLPLADNKPLAEYLAESQSGFEYAVAKTDLLISWSRYIDQKTATELVGLAIFVELLEQGLVQSTELCTAYEYCTYSEIVRAVFIAHPKLAKFTGLKHGELRAEFQRLDKEIIKAHGKVIGQQSVSECRWLTGQTGSRVDDKTEAALLQYLLPQTRPRMPVRKMLARAGKSIQALKPCFMMGPQAVAQYLTPGVSEFDIVIMDEASQLKAEEAIGAIARGTQLVVVGDPKQLPPTSFFSRMTNDDDDEPFAVGTAQSILDVCAAHFQHNRMLRWHYRSQHHSLIAFSNKQFYKNKLIVFPSPYGQSPSLGVRAVYLIDAVYENQMNVREAERVVELVIEHTINRPDESLGVVTLNTKQRDLIAELLTSRFQSHAEAQAYRKNWHSREPLFVKNLENVQGDERDAIIISTTFGKPQGSSAVRQNFGPINQRDGGRRLNVLFTRAKRSVTVCTSLRPEDIVTDGATHEGTQALRDYLEYARTGVISAAEETGRAPDSDFEISVLEMLRLKGYEVTPQLGVAGYRIDIAVKHPDWPGVYLAAIECDGATYHSAASVRDRDRIRQEVIEALGWRGRIWRIWSTDWFRLPKQETAKLMSFLDNLRLTWKPEHSVGETWTEESLQPNTGSTDDHSTPTSLLAVGKLPTKAESATVANILMDLNGDIEIEIGDTVRYADMKAIHEVLTIQIVRGSDDSENGLVNMNRPICQALLGAVIGDEVPLRFPGKEPKIFRVIEIKKNLVHT